MAVKEEESAPKVDQIAESYPIQALAQKRHQLLNESCTNPDTLRKEILANVKEKAMLPYYEQYLCPVPLGALDEQLKEQMQKENEVELEKIDAKIKDAKENLGDMEVRDALIARADFFNRIGDKESALAAYQDAFEKTVGVGGRLDNILTVIRIAFFFDDHDLAKKEIERAKAELNKGGDWERRNKLKVYEGVYMMISRNWKDAANLFLNVMPTFTALELVEFKEFVFYAVILSMVSLDRADLREKLVSSPEVLSTIKDTPHLQEFLNAYFYCDYKNFMVNFVHITDALRSDRYLARHTRHFMRIMRLNAYRQFLASYRSVKLEAMASEFGVSADFIDAEISSFISSGRLSCKIDRVGQIIESNKSDTRSQIYVDIIKQGDLLLNRVQKLSGAVDI